MSKRSDGAGRPPDAEVAHGSAGAKPGIDEMGEIGLISVHFTKDSV